MFIKVKIKLGNMLHCYQKEILRFTITKNLILILILKANFYPTKNHKLLAMLKDKKIIKTQGNKVFLILKLYFNIFRCYHSVLKSFIE